MTQEQLWTSNFGGVVRWSGGRQVLRKGQTIAEDHPLRVERPDLFELADPAPQLSMEPPVERGTRAPGERRPSIARGERR